jgi:sensor histidine kinase YesM
MNFLPVGLSVPVSDIAAFITGININNVDKEIKDEYKLEYFENNITVNFAGVDLTGFIPLFQYSLNDGSWQNTETQVLSLKELAPGTYKIRIRAYKRDGTPSARYSLVRFYIKTPFWKQNLFWAANVLTAFLLVIYFLQKRNQRKQQQVIDKISTEKRLAELEMQALMAQINPHFVFNCLNSIKGFVYDKDFKQADIYLDKFSELLRSTMDNAEASVITLDREIKYLDTYLQLEKLRFENKFSYSITADDHLDKQQVFVPAMLLQPYVENAIRHGIRHLAGNEGRILISAVKQDKYLVFTIDDNGVGREKAQDLKTARHIEYQSRGMSLSKRRAELYNILQEIVDKKDDSGKSSGTTIVLKIPLSLHS